MRKPSNHSTPQAVRHGTAGFTLIELMVVLVLLALMAGMIAPSVMSAMRRKGVLSQGEDLAELLRFAQSYAVTSRRPVQVNLDSARGLCWATVVHTPLPWRDDEAAGSPETIGSLKLQRGVAVMVQSADSSAGGAWNTITFASNGCTKDALLQVSDGRSPPMELFVAGTEGSVQLREGAL
jgi:type II secretion system protein H